MNNEKIGREDLVEEMFRLSEEVCDGDSPTVREMKDKGKYSREPYRREFGSWNEALKACGFGVNKENVTDKDYLEEIERVSEEHCGGKKPTFTEFDKYSKYTSFNAYRKFGSWVDAIKKSGVKYERGKTKEELLNEIHRLKDKINSVPTTTDMDELGKYSTNTYQENFGSWNNALEEAGLELNSHYSIPKEEMLLKLKEAIESKDKVPVISECKDFTGFHSSTYNQKFGSWTNAIRKVGYEPVISLKGEDNPLWKEVNEHVDKSAQRRWSYHVKKRDDYQCQDCDNPRSESLFAHHIKRKRNCSDDEKWDIDNGITLCADCHAERHKGDTEYKGLKNLAEQLAEKGREEVF